MIEPSLPESELVIADAPRREIAAPVVILCVQDLECNRYVRPRALRAAGFHVVESVNGPDALRLAADEQPSLIVLDIRLPEPGDFDLARRLKSDPRTQSIPLLRLSAAGRMDDDSADLCLREPVETGTLIGAAKALIRAGTAERRLQHAEERIREAEQRVSEHAHERQRELLEGIVQNIPVMLCLYDPALRTFELNRECERVLGWTTDEANDGDFMAKVYPDPGYRAEAIEYMQSLTPGWRELIAVAKDGTAVPSEWANVRLSDDRLIGIGIDLRAKKQAEKALRESEERFRTLADNISQLAWMAEPDGSVSWYNRRWYEYTGTTLEEMQGWGWRKVHDPDHLDRVVDRFKRSIATGEPWEDTFPLRGKDGNYRWFLSRALPIRDAGGRVVRWFGTNTDVTELREAEERLSESEARARRRLAEIEAIYESAPIGLCVFDTNLRWVRLNKRIAEINGAPVEAHIGKTPREIIPDIGEQAEAALRRILETGEPLMDFEMSGTTPAQPGVVRYWIERWTPLKDEQGRITGISVATEEITEKKLADAALRASEARERARAAELQAIMEAVPVATFIARDRECREMVGSRMTYDVLRLPYGSNLSMSAPEGQRPATFKAMKDGREMAPEDLPAQRAAASGKPVRNFEFDVVFEDGTSRKLLGDAVPLFGEDGQPRGAVGGFVDITEHKRSEERLRQSQKLESIGLLAGGIAHDFNNLLTGIIGNASMVLDEVDDGPAEHIREALKSAERAANLTRQLLAYAGKGQFILRELDISQAVSEMCSLVQFSIPKSVVLKLNLEQRLPVVRMDPGQLQQILMNLVINAGEAIGEGNPGTITVSTGVSEIGKAFTDALGEEAASGPYVFVEVSDTGSGIDENKRPNIFEPFFTTKFTGRGLGLAAVAGIIRSQKGAIEVKSVPGSGSTFRVLLPAAPARDKQTAANQRGAILVVDDEATVRDVISAVLRREGYRVVLASDGRDALAACERESGNIDVAIIDVVMPVMSANDLIPAFRALHPNTKILLTSGHCETEARRLCPACPGAPFIQKPYTAKELAEAVEVLIGDQKN